MANALLNPVHDDATRRQFLTAVGAAGLLTACTTATAPPAPAAKATWTEGPFGPGPAVTAGRVVEYSLELYYASPLAAPALATGLAGGLA